MAGALQVKADMALVGESLRVEKRVCISVREGLVESITSQASCRPGALGGENLIVTPQPALLHAHSGDHAFPEYGVDMRLEALVAPPHGLKHRRLQALPGDILLAAVTEYYRLAWRLGVGLLADFREGGGVGCSIARRALESAPEGIAVVVLGRPGPEFPRGCDGLGLSSPLDYEGDELRRLVDEFKPAFTHVAETRESRLMGDFELALEAGFTGVVHGTHLSREDLEAMKSRGMGLVLCPRSNLWHGVGVPPVREALTVLDRVGVGSDNASWMTPNIWREMEAALLLARSSGPTGEWLAERLLRGVFIESYRMVGARPRLLAEGAPAYFLVFNSADYGMVRAESPYYGLVKRLGGENLVARVDMGEVSFV